MKKVAMGLAALAAIVSGPASAAVFNFTFDTTSTLFGGPNQTIRGTFTTLDTPVDRFGFSGLAITGISGTINGTTITGLFDTGSPYYYLTSGPTFLDGSGVRFNAGAAQNIAFFHQDGVAADTYRVNGNGTISAFGPATSSAAAIGGAVPEPASWLMIIAGFGGIGFAMRRRRKSNNTTSAAYA